MATKKTKAATTARASVIKSIDLRPTPSQLKAAQACLERSGKIQIGFKQISVTKLPKRITPVASFND
jgi:hypothetical protein